MSSLEGQGRRRFLAASLALPLVPSLVGCGGGADDTSEELREQPTARSQAATTDQHAQRPAKFRRRARSYARRGVTAIAMAPDGSAVAVAYADGRLRLLDGEGSRDRRLIKGRGGAPVVGLVFSANGRLLVAVGRDSAAEFWSVETGERRWVMHGHEHALRSVATSADGSVVATAGDETRVMLWDGTTGKLKRIVGGHTDFVNSVSLSPTGQLGASGDADARVLVWSVSKGGLLHTLRGHADEVNAVAFSPDGALLTSAAEDGKLILWDMLSGRQIDSLQGHRAALRTLSFSADGGLLAAGGVDGRVAVWDMRTRSLVSDVAASSGVVNVVIFDRKRKNWVFVGDEHDGIAAIRL